MSDDPDRSAGIGLPADPDQMGIVMGTAMAGVATTAATQEILTNAVHKLSLIHIYTRLKFQQNCR